ncbi:MAG: hypothetical protein IPN69_08735 [Acidobacteria bacterium]|nr:hypothetical protein [Acidobacteriota bacterium]
MVVGSAEPNLYCRAERSSSSTRPRSRHIRSIRQICRRSRSRFTPLRSRIGKRTACICVFQYYDEQKRPKIPGRLVINKTQAIEAKPDEMVETRIDLSEALSGGFGSAIIEVEPTVRRDKYDRTKITA